MFIFVHIFILLYIGHKKLESETTVIATGVVHLCIREHMELMMTMGIRNL